MRTARQRLIPLLLVPLIPAPVSHASAQTAPNAVTVPLVMVNHRPFVDVTFRRADGTTRTARLLLDTGGGAFIIVEPLARDLGLTWGTPQRGEDGVFAAPSRVPDVRIDGFPLQLNPQRVAVAIGSTNIMTTASGAQADGMIPGHVLSQYHVVFDYPARTLTLARPGVLTPRGAALAMAVNPRSGFARTEILVDGNVHGMLLDTGASFTMVSEALLKSWGAAHPDWKRYAGAYGDAATLGGQTLETMFLPALEWGGQQVSDAGVTSQQEGVFEKYMSRMMAAPIEGSLAGNVLEQFRVEIDYANQKLYLVRGRDR